MTKNTAAIVLVGITHPGNLGAAARAMTVMGLQRMVLARTRASPGDSEAVAMAAGCERILAQATAADSLETALEPMQRAYAFTARRRGLSHELIDARAAGARAAEEIAAGLSVAFVFGPERTGLSNAETELCDVLVEIPTSATKSSLNVAAAVQIACYELRLAAAPGQEAPRRELASKKEHHDLLEHAEQVIVANCPPKHPGLRGKMLQRLAILAHRASPDRADMRMLRGLLSAVEKLQRGASKPKH